MTLRWVSSEAYAPAASSNTGGGQGGSGQGNGEGSGKGAATSAPAVVKATLFVIRHGESKWNDAQDKQDVKGMVQQVDHELDGTGIAQVLPLLAQYLK